MSTLLPRASKCLGCSQSWGCWKARGGSRAGPRLGASQRICSTARMGSQGPLRAGTGSWRESPCGDSDDPPPLAGNVERLSKMYPKISKAQNAELRLRWCQIVLKNNLEAEYSKVKDFLHSQVGPCTVVAVPTGGETGMGHRTFHAREPGVDSCS